MDTRLATYLFGDEMLYAVGKNTELLTEKVEPKSNLEQKPPIENKVVAPKPVLIETAKSIAPPVSDKTEEIAQDELVFGMKTHHLFVFSNLEADEKDFLLKVLQALGLSFTKVDLLDIQKEPLVDFKQTIHENVVRTIVFFGEESGKDFLPKLKLPAYEVKNLKNINFLFSDTLKQVASNEANEKRLLWAALKGIFQN